MENNAILFIISRAQLTWMKTFLILFVLLTAFGTIFIAIHSKECLSFNLQIESTSFNITKLRKLILDINQAENVLNEDIFGQERNYSLVIAVQVNTRIRNLKHLIYSLQMARGISDVLLIFSHGVFDLKINKIIKSVKFCRVIQLFYPYSMQLYPNEFPGSDPSDCLVYKSRNLTCKNIKYLNREGRYRNPGYAQVKHHWWWKAHKIFNLRVLDEYDDLVLFLEDDYYVLEDFIHLLKLMKSTAKSQCPQCKIFSLAEHIMALYIWEAWYNEYDVVKTTIDYSNMAPAFNRSTWLEIQNHKKLFCTMNDIDWDNALQHIFTNIMPGLALTPRGPRVYHAGKCGLHFWAYYCDPSATIAAIRTIVERVKRFLFPTELYIVDQPISYVYNNLHGGWRDPRDFAFCLGMGINYL